MIMPSVFGENMNSAFGLNLRKPSMINCALMALVMLCAIYAGQTEFVLRRNSPKTSAVGKMPTMPKMMNQVMPMLV